MDVIHILFYVNICHIFVIQSVCMWLYSAYKYNIGEYNIFLTRDMMWNCISQHYGGMKVHAQVGNLNACENIKKKKHYVIYENEFEFSVVIKTFKHRYNEV